jgi:hypothetical protein
MSTITSPVKVRTSQRESSSPVRDFFSSLLAIELREKLDAASTGDKTDSIYAWGM